MIELRYIFIIKVSYLIFRKLLELFVLIDVWGFDEDVVKVLENMRLVDENLIYKYVILFSGKYFKFVMKDLEVM